LVVNSQQIYTHKSPLSR